MLGLSSVLGQKVDSLLREVGWLCIGLVRVFRSSTDRNGSWAQTLALTNDIEEIGFDSPSFRIHSKCVIFFLFFTTSCTVYCSHAVIQSTVQHEPCPDRCGGSGKLCFFTCCREGTYCTHTFGALFRGRTFGTS